MAIVVCFVIIGFMFIALLGLMVFSSADDDNMSRYTTQAAIDFQSELEKNSRKRFKHDQ
jgi:hypothetical protein